MLKAWIFLVTLGFATLSWAEPSQDWTELRSLYDSGKLDDALLLLQKHPSQDAAYYYNQGTLFLRTQRAGLAVPYLEKARRLNPLDGDIRHNLSLAQRAASHTLNSERQDAASNFIDRIADELSSAPARAAASLMVFALLLVSLKSYARSRSLKEWLTQGVGPLGAFGLIGLLVFCLSPQLVGARPLGYSLERQVIRSGPGEQFVDLGQLETGAELRIQDYTQTTGNTVWRQIRFTSDSVGWVQEAKVLIL